MDVDIPPIHLADGDAVTVHTKLKLTLDAGTVPVLKHWHFTATSVAVGDLEPMRTLIEASSES